ncbi:hypothetical protein BD779DRAFT_1480898 [Infundibulicybe gibba]|nr:hypothetical protein BD779DRAFT_1480898 [Infundibulicybe gibba]
MSSGFTHRRVALRLSMCLERAPVISVLQNLNIEMNSNFAPEMPVATNFNHVLLPLFHTQQANIPRFDADCECHINNVEKCVASGWNLAPGADDNTLSAEKIITGSATPAMRKATQANARPHKPGRAGSQWTRIPVAAGGSNCCGYLFQVDGVYRRSAGPGGSIPVSRPHVQWEKAGTAMLWLYGVQVSAVQAQSRGSECCQCDVLSVGMRQFQPPPPSGGHWYSRSMGTGPAWFIYTMGAYKTLGFNAVHVTLAIHVEPGLGDGIMAKKNRIHY